jgi:hypothetical protein
MTAVPAAPERRKRKPRRDPYAYIAPSRPEPGSREHPVLHAITGAPRRDNEAFVRLRQHVGDRTLIRYLVVCQASNQRHAPGTTPATNAAAETLQREVEAALDRFESAMPFPRDFGGPHAAPVERIADVINLEERRAARKAATR